MLGRFHEISVPTQDIRASIEFYEALGFSQAQTGDTWSHPYGVVGDGRLVLGLHQASRPARITYVRPRVAELATELTARGIELSVCHIDPEQFNEIAFQDPSGQLVSVLEARTYSPLRRDAREPSACGDFAELSLPAADFSAARGLWEALGFVATGLSTAPYPRLALTSDHLDLAFHPPRVSPEPLLVFTDERMSERIARLREQGHATGGSLPAGLSPRENALLRAPEGTLLLLTGHPQS